MNTLRNQLETADSEIVKPTNHFTQPGLEVTNLRKKVSEITDQRDQLLIISSRKDGTIERMRSEIKMLEAQLTSATSAKYDALNRLFAIESKQQSLDYKEKCMEKERDFLNNEIASLKDILNKPMAELLALRQESTSAAVQMEIELKRKTDELRVSNATICQLTETNQLLTDQSEEIALKLKEQVNESVRLMDHYQKEVDVKTKLADLYKENSDDHQAQINKLTAAVKELKGMLNESTDECGVLETKLRGIDEKHQIELDAKAEIIDKLKQELQIANELLKTAEDEHAEIELENLCPSNVAASRRLNRGITLTEIYFRYYKVIDELQSMELDTEAIITELLEKAPKFDNLCVEYKKIVAVNDELTQKIDNYIVEKVLIRKELQETRSKFGYLERENAKLKSGQNDLARQVCHLLNEIEASRGGMSSDQNQSISSDMSANEVISKKLVTFNNIVEMQENNQKLLLLVRDLSKKLEEMEEIQNSIDVDTYEAKIAGYEKRLHDAEQSRRANEDLLANCLKQAERFKRLYYDIMKDVCKKPSASGSSFISEPCSEPMEGIDDLDLSANVIHSTSSSAKDKKILELEQRLQEKMNELKDLKEDYNEYRKGKSEKSKMLNEQIDTLRNEVRELTAANLKVSSQANYTNEQIKTQQKNVTIYKRQIESLEECNQMHEKTITKHEISSKYLRDEASNTMNKLSAAESRNEHLQRECRRLMDINRSLEVEHQSLNREKLSSSILQSNLEMIKGSFERLDNEGRLPVEQRLDDTVRECSALRRRLQEEQNYFRAEINAMKIQMENAEKKMLDEQSLAETLRAKLTKADQQIEAQNQEIKELTRKIQQSLLSSHFDNPIDDANNKIKELELQLKNKTLEVDKLKNQKQVESKEAELIQMASGWEGEAKVIKENFVLTEDKLMADLQASRLNETKLKIRVGELETGLLCSIDTGIQTKLVLNEFLDKVSQNDREVRDFRSECKTLTMNLKTIEHKYSHEMRSLDLQAFTICEDELNKVQINQLRFAKHTINQSLQTCRLEWEKLNKVTLCERKSEQKLGCMNQQCSSLYDLLDAQNNIKFVRKEKDISVTNAEILKTENSRLVNEGQMQTKHASELNLQLTTAQAHANTASITSAAKNNHLKRKIETLNEVTDSSIHLRDERDALVGKVRYLTDRVAKLEDELFPLQNENRELSVKNEEQTHECNMLRTNLKRLKERLVKQNSDTSYNLKDFRRFQNERETLAKMLTTEKENLRQVIEELNLVKSDKVRLEQEVAATNKPLHSIIDDKMKTQEGLNNLKQRDTQVFQEITAPLSPNVGTNKRRRDGMTVEEFSALKILSPQNKRTRCSKQSFEGVTDYTYESHDTYGVPDITVEIEIDGSGDSSFNESSIGIEELLSATSQACIADSQPSQIHASCSNVIDNVQANIENVRLIIGSVEITMDAKKSLESQVNDGHQRNDVALSHSCEIKTDVANQSSSTIIQDAGTNGQVSSQQYKQRMHRENYHIQRARGDRFWLNR